MIVRNTPQSDLKAVFATEKLASSAGRTASVWGNDHIGEYMTMVSAHSDICITDKCYIMRDQDGTCIHEAMKNKQFESSNLELSAR